MKKMMLTLILSALCSMCFSTASHALLFDQNVTPDVIFGSGVTNGAFTVDRQNGVELGLRGKLRFDENNQPQNTFNSNHDGTYTFNKGAAPGGFSWFPNSSTTPVWSFEWSINSDYSPSGSTTTPLSTYSYEIGMDFDPGVGTDYLTFDPINILPGSLVPDHAIGDNTTWNGGGYSASDEDGYQRLIDGYNVAQNSWNMEFFNDESQWIFNPNLDATYDFYISAFDGSDVLIANSAIQIIVGQGAPVSEPAAFILLGTGLLGLGRGLKSRSLRRNKKM